MAYTVPEFADPGAMSDSRHYDTVAFDVRRNATILFFAKTTPNGDIEDYLLLMRATGAEFDDSLYLEMNEREFAGHDLISQARLEPSMLTLQLHQPAPQFNGVQELVLTYDDTDENRASIEAGALRVLGDTLAGGNA